MRKACVLLLFFLNLFPVLVSQTFTYADDASELSPSPSTVAEITGAPIQFAETSDYVRLNFTMFIFEFYKSGYEKIYAKNGSVLAYYHNMLLDYYNPVNKKWVQCGVFQQLSWRKIDDYHYQVEKLFQDSSTSPKTNYTVIYDVKSDSRVKITVKLESGVSRQYRVHWSLDGIVYADWREQKNSENFKCGLVFGNEDLEFGWVAIDWQDVYEQFHMDVSSYSVATSAQGRKADVYFDVGTIGGTLTIDPSVVGTSTTTTAVALPFQRKAFYANGRFWVFYSDGSNMVYRTSTDGSTWTDTTNVRECPAGHCFSIWFDGTYVHYAYVDSGRIYYRRGTPNSDGTITWSASEQTVPILYANTYYPFVSVDSSGYVWIGYCGRSDIGYYYPYVIRSGNNDGTWGTTPSGFPYQLSSGITDAVWHVTAVPLTSGKMLVVYTYASDVVRLRSWNGSAWNPEVTVSSTIQYGYCHSVVAEGDDADIVFLKSTGYNIVHVRYTYSSNSLSAEHTVIAGAPSTSAPVLCRDYTEDKLYVFWATKTTGSPSGATANHIYYQTSTNDGVTWSSPVDWIDESSEVLSEEYTLTCFYQLYAYMIGLVYMTKTASPFNVKFAFLSTNAAPTIGGFQAPARFSAGKFFFLNCTINDADGTGDFLNATLKLNETVTLKWDCGGDTFSKIYDADNICVLGNGSFKTSLNATAYKLSFNISLNTVGVWSITGKVYDKAGFSGTGSVANAFITDMLIVVFAASPPNPLQGDTVTISWTIRRLYDNSTVTDFIIDVARDGVLWKSGLTVNYATDTETNAVSHTYNVYQSVVDNTYGLSTWASVPVTVTWQSPGGPSGGPGGAPYITPTPTPTPTPAPPVSPVAPPPTVDLTLMGIIVIVAVIVGASLSRESASLSLGRRVWSKRRSGKRLGSWRKRRKPWEW